MATMKKGCLALSPQLWKHLRWYKRVYWKRERRAGSQAAWKLID